MKRILLVGILFFFAWPVFAAAETFIIDPSHSYVQWSVSHFGFSNVSGKWYVNGTLALDEAKPKYSNVNITIKIGDLVTGIPKLDEHLKSDDFFNSAKFPTATFISDKIDVTGSNTAKVHGTLTVHGVSKPIVLDVKLNKLGVSPISNKKTAGFTATAKLKRSDFGVDAYLPGISDDVKINIETEAAADKA